MSYEVTKLVHGRPYRYRVRSERDAVTGKMRNRWTYLGRADADARAEPVRTRRNAREALLDALERLFATEDPDRVTAAAVAAEAGVAHGTFYRYFRSKQDAIAALIDRVRGEVSERDGLDSVPEARDEARRAFRVWAETVIRAKERHGALFRALYTLWSRDETLLAQRRERRNASIDRMRGYLERLIAKGFVTIADPGGTALGLAALIDGIFRETLHVAPLDDARIAATIDLMERAVFGRLD
jgi:AcrR family transcriptional regulator